MRDSFGQKEEIIENGNDLFVKSNLDPNYVDNTLSEYQSDWSKLQNIHIVKRMKKVYKWIYQNYAENCTHVFGCTVTSIFELETLKIILDAGIKKNLFAGNMCVYQNFQGMRNFVFLSGANNVFTVDLLDIVANHDDEIDALGMPNDVWLSVRFKSIPRAFLPRFDFELKVDEIYPSCNLSSQIEDAFSKGHFHIRVKSQGDREKIDHIILMDIYRKIFLGLRPNLNALNTQLKTYGRAVR